MTLQNSIQSSVQQLTGAEINSLKVTNDGISFRLVAGRAWITVDDNDVIVEKDEVVHLPISKHHIIISSANRYQPIQYQLISA